MRSRRDRVIAGVCGGIAEYLGLDPTLVRVATVVIALLPGPAVLAYLIAWLVIPEETNGNPAAPRPPRPAGVSDSGRYIAGGVLIAIGGLWLLGELLPWVFNATVVLPVVLIALGAALLIQGARR
jgi:phage shock protein C